jgi:two-component system response regulator YesN
MQSIQSIPRSSSTGFGLAIGEPVSAVHAVWKSYETAQRALRRLRLLGLPQVIWAGDLELLSALPAANYHELARTLVENLRNGYREGAMETLTRLFAELQGHDVDPSVADAYLARIQFVLLDFIEELGYGKGNVPEELSSLFQARHFSSLSQAEKHFTDTLIRILDFLMTQKKRAVDSRMDHAIKVIRDRYGECDLSLRNVCDEVYLSVSQFSALFKEATGQTFVEYLTKHRIEAAKELLRTTNLRTYEIAERVGYADPRYFTSVLKKHTGMTSSQLRERT